MTRIRIPSWLGAFTLIELLAVVGIMGMMGVAAAASYGALINGMKDRSACSAASAILREACERAQVDRLPTVVYCYNVCLREPTADDPGVVVGMMTAIRRVGRITGVDGEKLFDEFADLDQSYDSMDDEDELRKMSGHRLFKYNDESSAPNMQYSIVADAVYHSEDDLNMPTVTTFWPGIERSRTNLVTSAFYNLRRSDHEPNGGWKIGDGYAAEFAELQLPDGYVFGSTLPRGVGKISECDSITFVPDSGRNDKVDICLTRPDANGRPTVVRKAGQADASWR